MYHAFILMLGRYLNQIPVMDRDVFVLCIIQYVFACQRSRKTRNIAPLQHEDFSIWFLDRSLQFHRLASTFSDYYRLLLLHCGLPYWHYKYTDSGIPPYILHWYYIIAPALLTTHSNDDLSLSNAIPFNSEKVFQHSAAGASKFDWNTWIIIIEFLVL